MSLLLQASFLKLVLMLLPAFMLLLAFINGAFVHAVGGNPAVAEVPAVAGVPGDAVFHAVAGVHDVATIPAVASISAVAGVPVVASIPTVAVVSAVACSIGFFYQILDVHEKMAVKYLVRHRHPAPLVSRRLCLMHGALLRTLSIILNAFCVYSV